MSGVPHTLSEVPHTAWKTHRFGGDYAPEPDPFRIPLRKPENWQETALRMRFSIFGTQRALGVRMTMTCHAEHPASSAPHLAVAAVMALCSETSSPLGGKEGASRAMDRYSTGDDAAFPEVYEFIAPRLFSSLSRKTRDRARAEDLLQRTFMHIHRSRGTFIPGSDVLRWAYAISRRLGIDELRRRTRDPVDHAAAPEADWPCPAEGFAEAELAARQMAGHLQSALATMPQRQREAFELLRFEGLSHEEAAVALGTTVSAVKLRAHRAYEALRSAIDHDAAKHPKGCSVM